MNYLTIEQILFLHARLISETGGSHGIHNLGLLESAVARPKATFDRKELYSDIFQKAAALLDSLINNHPFTDGNKRTGIAATALFLRLNGWRLTMDNEGLEELTLMVATEHPEICIITEQLRQNSQRD